MAPLIIPTISNRTRKTINVRPVITMNPVFVVNQSSACCTCGSGFCVASSWILASSGARFIERVAKKKMRKAAKLSSAINAPNRAPCPERNIPGWYGRYREMVLRRLNGRTTSTVSGENKNASNPVSAASGEAVLKNTFHWIPSPAGAAGRDEAEAGEETSASGSSAGSCVSIEGSGTRICGAPQAGQNTARSSTGFSHR